jgi:hypothetical protein
MMMAYELMLFDRGEQPRGLPWGHVLLRDVRQLLGAPIRMVVFEDVAVYFQSRDSQYSLESILPCLHPHRRL